MIISTFSDLITVFTPLVKILQKRKEMKGPLYRSLWHDIDTILHTAWDDATNNLQGPIPHGIEPYLSSPEQFDGMIEIVTQHPIVQSIRDNVFTQDKELMHLIQLGSDKLSAFSETMLKQINEYQQTNYYQDLQKEKDLLLHRINDNGHMLVEMLLNNLNHFFTISPIFGEEASQNLQTKIEETKVALTNIPLDKVDQVLNQIIERISKK